MNYQRYSEYLYVHGYCKPIGKLSFRQDFPVLLAISLDFNHHRTFL